MRFKGVFTIIKVRLSKFNYVRGEFFPDIVDTAMLSGMFNRLVNAVKNAGLVETLKSPGPFAVFAPTDETFSKLPKDTLDSILKDQMKLKDILNFCVV